MSALILSGVVGACVTLIVVAFVLVVLDNRRKDVALTEASADKARLKEQRNTAMDLKRASEAALQDAVRQLEQARAEIANYARAGNRLYREAMEDQQARQLQAALLLKNAKRDVDDAFRVLNQDGDR